MRMSTPFSPRFSDIRAERAADRSAAKTFEEACASGDVNGFNESIESLKFSIVGWRLGMKRVARLQSVSPDIQNAFVNVWVEHKHLPLEVGEPRVVVEALRVLLPKPRRVAPRVRLFRGAGGRERRLRVRGFSWTRSRKVAETFAKANESLDEGGVVFETIVKLSAILYVRKDIANYYEETEYIVDPYRLNEVEIVRTFPCRSPNTTL